jgi:hypothetical protein
VRGGRERHYIFCWRPWPAGRQEEMEQGRRGGGKRGVGEGWKGEAQYFPLAPLACRDGERKRKNEEAKRRVGEGWEGEGGGKRRAGEDDRVGRHA